MTRKSRPKPYKGLVERNSALGWTITWGGAYFDWPLWKRTLSKLLVHPVSILYGLYLGLRYWLYDPFHPRSEKQTGEDEHGTPIIKVSVSSGFGIGRALAESRIRPIYAEVDFHDGDSGDASSQSEGGQT